MANGMATDQDAIRVVIDRQFASLSWDESIAPGWDGFAGDFLDGASLYPAARPARRIGVVDFVERMRGLSRTSLRSLQETVLGTDISVFGNIAIAAVAAEMIENSAETSRSMEMLLLVKSEGQWKIVGQAWDKATDSNPLPDALVSGVTSR
ncbi:nuclear transport factor 2 family protein [Mesorhizobium carmichaelinearum]|uniref:nuclear transport factor 2 family protein n=1 Tax=Mesorhizobium carmichaelinearum TaxID=1208188 RepID=UPI000BA43144|nr:nuclear transport factor 2 family protein [Mesorhizobium carmichaelinearum]